MANILDKIMHGGDEYDFPEWFSPESAGTQWQVLTKGSGDTYDWSNPAWWDVVVSPDANNTLTTWAWLRAWTEANYQNISTPDSNTLYFTF